MALVQRCRRCYVPWVEVDAIAMSAGYSPLIISSALIDPFRVCENLGGDPWSIRGLVGIDDARDAEMVPLRQFTEFFQVTSERLRCPVFGWAVGADFDLRSLGGLGQFVLEAPTLGAALSLFQKAFAMVQSDSELDLTVEADEAVLTYRILDLNIWPREQDAEMTMSVFHQLIKSVAGADWRTASITLEHDTSAIWKDAEIGPRCNVEYNAVTNSLRFPARLLDLPMQGVRSETHTGVTQAFSREAWQRERDAPVFVRVRREIIRRLGREGLDQTDIANRIGFSRRTLRRRLEEEEQSFSDILSDCRVRYAEIALRSSDRSLSDISEYLGYSSVSAFERAFKSKKNMTPAKYRRHVSGKVEDRDGPAWQ